MLIMPLDLNLNSNIQSYKLTNLFYCTHSSLLKSSDLITGNYLNKTIDGAKLKKGFGWFVLFMSLVIILEQVFG
jgi:hypothetical protein